MIRLLVSEWITAGRQYIKAAGLSTDTKPTTGIATGSKFVEVDTGARFIYDEVSQNWNEDDAVESAVDAWLDDHPEATTTVQDGAITNAKLDANLQATVADVGDLKTQIDDLEEAVAVENWVDATFTSTPQYLIGSNGTVTSIANNSYVVSSQIPVTAGKAYKITASANYWNLLYAWYKSDDTFISGRGTGGSGSTIISAVDESVTAPANAAYLRIAYISPPYTGKVSYVDGLSNNLLDRVDALDAEIGTIDNFVLPVNYGKVQLIVNEGNLRFTDVESGNYITAGLNTSQNGAFNLNGYYSAGGTAIKSADDDICPIFYDGGHRGGNHGHLCVIAVTAAGHGLTEADIGKVVTSANGVDYVIVTIKDEDKFWMVNDSNTHTFITSIPTSPLSGTNINVAFSSAELKQLWPGANNITQKLYCDSTEIESDGTYIGSKISVVDGYYLIDTLAMLSVLKTNVGNNTNESYYADTLPADLYYETTYIITAGLGMYVSSTVLTIRDGINLGSWGVVQSIAISASPKSFVADSTDQDIMPSGTGVLCNAAMWKDSSFPPYKFFQFDGGQSTKGFAIVYDLSVDACKPTTRVSKVPATAYNSLSSAFKMYPYAINLTTASSLASGTVIRGAAYRVPITNGKPLVIVYKVGIRTVVEIDTFNTGLNIVSVPNCKGKEIKVVHTSEGVNVVDTIAYGEIKIFGKGSVSLEVT